MTKDKTVSAYGFRVDIDDGMAWQSGATRFESADSALRPRMARVRDSRRNERHPDSNHVAKTAVRSTHFAEALKAARTARGVPQKSFSTISGRSYISALERGLKSPTLGKVEELAAVLGIHPLTLIGLSYATEGPYRLKELLLLIETETRALYAGPAARTKPRRPANAAFSSEDADAAFEQSGDGV